MLQDIRIGLLILLRSYSVFTLYLLCRCPFAALRCLVPAAIAMKLSSKKPRASLSAKMQSISAYILGRNVSSNSYLTGHGSGRADQIMDSVFELKIESITVTSEEEAVFSQADAGS